MARRKHDIEHTDSLDDGFEKQEQCQHIWTDQRDVQL